MTELEKIERAKEYIYNLANGINPLTEEPIPDDDIVNQVRISRCLFFTAEILEQVLSNGGIDRAAQTRKKKFAITQEQLNRFEYSDTPIPISHITERVNSLIDSAKMYKLSHRRLTDWLIYSNALEEYVKANGQKAKRPTDLGEELGISTEVRVGKSGEYEVVLYNIDAQKLLIDNLLGILQWNEQR